MLTQKDFLLSSSLAMSFSRNKNSYILHKTKIIRFLLVILSILIPLIPARSHVVKRESTSSCNSILSNSIPTTTKICTPIKDQVFTTNDLVNLTWNPVNTLLIGTDSGGEVEINLFRLKQNISIIDEQVMLNTTNNPGLEHSVYQNFISFNITSGWFPGNTNPSENGSYTFIFRVTPKGNISDPSTLDTFDSDNFEVQVTVPPVSISTTSTSTSTPAPAPTPSHASIINPNVVQNDNKSEIALIAVASIAAFLAFVAIVIAIKSRKHVNNQTKQQSLSNLSASSGAPMIKPGSNNRDSESPAEAESIHSTTPLANKEEMRTKPKSTVSNENQPISASDAALLSDAFRKVLRKPDWKPEDEEGDDATLLQEEHLRRREAKELMKKELAEEGTDLQNISTRHTKIEICNTNDEQEGGFSRSLESGSK